MGWIRIRIDPELLPGSGTRKIQSWIRNKSFRIHNTGQKGGGGGSVSDPYSIESGPGRPWIRIQAIS